MSYADDYPDRIAFQNEFTVRSIDMDTFGFPKLRVTTWSSLFGKGGSYAVETERGAAQQVTLLSVQIETDDRSIRSHLEALVEDWNESPRERWIEELGRAAAKVDDYQQRQVAEFDKVVKAAEESAGFRTRIAELARAEGLS